MEEESSTQRVQFFNVYFPIENVWMSDISEVEKFS